jgi:hypothetical protein
VHQPPVQAPCAHNSRGMASINIFCHDSVLEPQLLVFLSLLLTISALRLSSSATTGHTLMEVQIMRPCNNALASAPQASTRSLQQNCSAQSSLKTSGPVLVGATSGLSDVLERVETVAPGLFPHIRRCWLKMHDDLLALRHFVVWGTAQM